MSRKFTIYQRIPEFPCLFGRQGFATSGMTLAIGIPSFLRMYESILTIALRKLTCIFFIFYISNIYGQQTNLEIYPLFGTLFNHSPAAAAIITEPSYGVRLAYTKRPRTASEFFEKFNYPAIGLAMNAVQYGDMEVFGSSLGGNATLTFYLIEKKKFNFQITTGMGAGIITKEYENSYKNQNTAIGSKFNLTATILAGLELEVMDKFYLKPQLGILHYSNGRTSLPNLGTNFVFGTIGLSHRINVPYHKDSFVKNGKQIKQFRNEISLCPGLSDRGGYIGGSIKNIVLPTYSIHYNRLFYTSRINAIKLGISGEYKNNDYDPAYNLLEFKDNADLALTFGNELFFGRTSLHASIGAYLYSYYQFRKFVYQRWGLSYRLPIKSDKFGLSVGVQLKVHLGAAELTEAKISMLF